MIAGLVPCSFIDYPGNLAAVVFTQGCNLQCPYCHNAQLISRRTANYLTSIELLAWLQSRVGKLTGVVLSGGEPTLHSELDALIGSIRALGFRIKLDTNGTNPDTLEHLLACEMLDYVAMDLKDIPERYNDWLTKRPVTRSIERSIGLLRASGVPHEFRTTLVPDRHDLPTLEVMRQWISGAPWYLQRLEGAVSRTTTSEAASEYQGMVAALARVGTGPVLRGSPLAT